MVHGAVDALGEERVQGSGDSFHNLIDEGSFCLGERLKDVSHPVVGRFGFADADADAGELVCAQEFNDGSHALMSRSAAARTEADDAKGQVHFVIDDNQVRGLGVEAIKQISGGVTAVVHEGARLGKHHGSSFELPLTQGHVLSAVGEGDVPAFGEPVDAVEADVVPGVSITSAGIAQSDDDFSSRRFRWLVGGLVGRCRGGFETRPYRGILGVVLR